MERSAGSGGGGGAAVGEDPVGGGGGGGTAGGRESLGGEFLGETHAEKMLHLQGFGLMRSLPRQN